MRLVATERLFILACGSKLSSGQPLTPAVSHGHCLLARCCMSTSATFLFLPWQWKCWLCSVRRPAARNVCAGVGLVRPSLTCRGKNLMKCSGRTHRGGVWKKSYKRIRTGMFVFVSPAIKSTWFREENALNSTGVSQADWFKMEPDKVTFSSLQYADTD